MLTITYFTGIRFETITFSCNSVFDQTYFLGPYNVTFKAVDYAGNVNETFVMFYVDPLPPLPIGFAVAVEIPGIGIAVPARVEVVQGESTEAFAVVTNIGKVNLTNVTTSVEIPKECRCKAVVEPSLADLPKDANKSFKITLTAEKDAILGDYELVIKVVGFTPLGRTITNSTTLTLVVKEKVIPPLKCPVCPQPSSWSKCIEGKQVRTNYKCGPETNYTCQPYEESQTREIPKPKPKGILEIFFEYISKFINFILKILRLR